MQINNFNSETLSYKDSLTAPNNKHTHANKINISDQKVNSPQFKGRASNIELSSVDIEILMHNYSNSDLRK